MSRFAGRLVLLDALHQYQGNSPKRVSVFGTGPAAMGAVLTAKSHQLPISVFGRQEKYRHIFETTGAKYFTLPPVEQDSFIRKHLANETIIITAARRVGKKAPILIDLATLAMLPEKTVIIDLSAGEGGSVIGGKHNEKVVVNNDILITNDSGYPKTEPRAASEAFAQCMVNLLEDIVSSGNVINFKNPLLAQRMKN